MSNGTTIVNIVFVGIFALEAVVIIIGNVFTIFVFWTQTLHLKRTCFLLINLAVADLLVGIAEAATVFLATLELDILNAENAVDIIVRYRRSSWAFEVFASSASVFFLALISLERVYAVLWPLRHRATNTRAYIYSIFIVWVAGLCLAGLSLLTIYHTKVDILYTTVTIASFLFISLLVICASYLKIHSRLYCTTPELENRRHMHKSREQSLRISRTLFIVIGVSLVFWLPSFIMGSIQNVCSCLPPLVMWFVLFAFC